uniref:P/Homo B domain-containing protein n=1 Tax=Wuchereria bancrofti TaxID=6293 RepID=A0A1I8EX92_WUCBA
MKQNCVTNFTEIKLMILFILLLVQIPKTYLISLIISIIIIISNGCETFHQQIWSTNSNETETVTLLSKFLQLDKLQEDNEKEEYDNEWVVEIVGGLEEARDIARAVGYKFIAPVRGFDNVYIFSKENYRKKRKADDKSTLALCRHKQKSSRTINGQPISMHVIKAWELGYTGKGVVVTILDDGMQHNHTDIIRNYDPHASYDLNDNDPDPMPKFNKMNRHGTRCAGEIVMTPNNSFCGVGIAYNAKIGGIRMLDGKITDRIEAEALNYNINYIDIFSASWGPMDDGKTVEGPGRLTQKAILKGIQQGRNGKGVIYVWASGNGGMQDDDCSCDGYMDSIYTLSVSSVTEDGTSPWYAEKCAATLTSTFSTDHYDKQMIATTDIENKCTGTFAGTSASAPMAAAIIALGLDANPSLTWRDVQHITVWTSDPIPLLNINNGWNKNARGLLVNSHFGFGLMDASAFVTVAKTWKNVPAQRACATIFPTFPKREINDKSVTVIKFQTDGCMGQKNEINFLEHIQLVLDAYYPIRGHLSILIISPKGTKTELLSVRRRDKSSAGFQHWPFMSVHTWGENPRGIWQLHIEDKSMANKAMTGIVNNITLIIYGTKEEPKHYKEIKRYRGKNEAIIGKQLLNSNMFFKFNRHLLRDFDTNDFMRDGKHC